MFNESFESKSSPSVYFKSFPKNFKLLEGAVTIKVPEDTCVQEFLFYRFKELAFLDYEEGDDIYVSDSNNIWIQVKIEREKRITNLDDPPKKVKKRRSLACCLLSIFFCMKFCPDDANDESYTPKIDQYGYEADISDTTDTDACETFKPLSKSELYKEVMLCQLFRDEGMGQHPAYNLFLKEAHNEL